MVELNPRRFEEMAGGNRQSLLACLKRVNTLSKNLKNLIDSKRSQGLILPDADGYDYYAYTSPIGEEDRQNLSRLQKSGSGINRADFHALMLNLGIRQPYLINFLKTQGLENASSPRKVLSRFKDNEIYSVATPTTQLLTTTAENKPFLVLFGINVLDSNGEIKLDSMEASFEFQPDLRNLNSVDEEFVTKDMVLKPGFISPLDILAILNTHRFENIFDNFSGSKYFAFTNQAEKVIESMPKSELVIPTTPRDQNNSYLIKLIGETQISLLEHFRQHNWQILNQGQARFF